MWRDDEVVGLLDFGHARPDEPLFDVAYALEYAAPFRDDEECLRSLRYPEPPDRVRRIELFWDAYGISAPHDIVARVADQQQRVLETCEALARLGIEPQATWAWEGYIEIVRARIDWTKSVEL